MTLVAIAFPEERDEVIINGAIVTHRGGNATGRCVFSDSGVSVHFRMKNGNSGKTETMLPHFVAQYWRLATDEEVRRYFDAD